MTQISTSQLAALLDAHAPWSSLAAVPGMSAWHAVDEVPLWQALEEHAGRKLPAPFFCVAWPGAQALALALAGGLLAVRGARVVDAGCGSGLAAAAAAMAGAREVVAADTDVLATQAAALLAERHGVSVVPLVVDVLEADDVVQPGDVVLCADFIYNRDQAETFTRVAAAWRARGVRVLVADSGRPFFHAQRFGLEEAMAVEVAASPGVDGRAQRTTRVHVWADVLR